MEKSDTIWRRFAELFDDGTSIRPAGPSAHTPNADGRTLRMLEHIDRGLHSLHAKADRLHADMVRITGRLDTMDVHVKALSDATNALVTAVNTTTANITAAMDQLKSAISDEDEDAIAAATSKITAAVANLNAANAAIADANKPVAAASGGQATPAALPGSADAPIDGAKPAEAVDPEKPAGDTETTAANTSNQ